MPAVRAALRASTALKAVYSSPEPLFFRPSLERTICVRTVRTVRSVGFHGVGADGRIVALAATVRTAQVCVRIAGLRLVRAG